MSRCPWRGGPAGCSCAPLLLLMLVNQIQVFLVMWEDERSWRSALFNLQTPTSYIRQGEWSEEWIWKLDDGATANSSLSPARMGTAKSKVAFFLAHYHPSSHLQNMLPHRNSNAPNVGVHPSSENPSSVITSCKSCLHMAHEVTINLSRLWGAFLERGIEPLITNGSNHNWQVRSIIWCKYCRTLKSWFRMSA